MMMNRTSYPSRFFGGHYDSVKQGAVRDSMFTSPIWKPYYLKQYNVRFKLDIMFGGTVVLTDAQYYDGTFFHILMSENRESFFKFLRNIAGLDTSIPLVEVRRRPGGLLTMLNKPFIFSSIHSGTVKNEIKGAMQKALEREIHKRDSLDKLFQNITDSIESEPSKLTFQEIAQNIRYLNEAPAVVFRTWDNPIPFSELLRTAKRKLKFIVRRTGNPEVDSVLLNIEQEMNKDLPNRSEIEVWIRTCKNSVPEFSDFLETIWGHVCQVYNCAIAEQHYCSSIDLGETPVSGKDAGIFIANISEGLLEAIAEDSWDEFHTRLSMEPLLSSWQNWRIAVSIGKDNLRKPLEQLVKNIQKSYGQVSTTWEDLKYFLAGLGVSGTGLKLVIGGGVSSSILAISALSFGYMITAGGIITLGLGAAEVASRINVLYKDRSNLIQYGLRIQGD